MTIYHGNGTLVGGAGRREGRLVVVGAVVLGGVLLGMGV